MDWYASRRRQRLVGAVAIAMALACVPMIVGTFLNPPLASAAIPVIAFPAVSPIFIYAVIDLRRRQGGGRRLVKGRRAAFEKAYLANGDRTLNAAIILGAFGVISSVTGGVAARGGQSERIADGRYALNNHGSLTIVTQHEYINALSGADRLFLGSALLFLSISFAILLTPPQARSTKA